jgi:lipoprotein-anchoring transpeptidase ErfK/SrfK
MKHATRKTLMVGAALLLALLLASTPYVTEATRVKAAGFSLQKQSTTKEIVVSLSRQWLWAYERGKEVYAVAVMTGRPDLATPLGTYHVFAKQSPTTFYSPWPRNSPYWYPPTYINYALAWKPGGYFLHDATWHSVFGPGTNRWHYDPIFGWQNGSHGCVAMTIGAAAWLYRWAPLGTTVRITV